MVHSKKQSKPFVFKQFKIEQDRCAMKVGTDGVLLGAWADVSEARTLLDIGTGTGVIAVMLAQRSDNEALIHAVEIDEQAFAQAQENFTESPFAHRLTVFQDSIQHFAENTPQKYDLIVSNPPFFTGGTFSSNQDKTNVRHTVKLPHGDLLHATQKLLNKNGKFCVILPLIEGLRFVEVARSFGFFCTQKLEVRSRKDKQIERLLLQFELSEKPLTVAELVILENFDDRIYSEAYKELTKAFYTIF